MTSEKETPAKAKNFGAHDIEEKTAFASAIALWKEQALVKENNQEQLVPHKPKGDSNSPLATLCYSESLVINQKKFGSLAGPNWLAEKVLWSRKRPFHL